MIDFVLAEKIFAVVNFDNTLLDVRYLEFYPIPEIANHLICVSENQNFVQDF